MAFVSLVTVTGLQAPSWTWSCWVTLLKAALQKLVWLIVLCWCAACLYQCIFIGLHLGFWLIIGRGSCVIRAWPSFQCLPRFPSDIASPPGPIRMLSKKAKIWEFLLWLSGLRTWCFLSEDAGSIPGLAQWLKDLAIATSFRVGRRCSSDPVLPWLWCRPAAEAPIWGEKKRTLRWKRQCHVFKKCWCRMIF